MKPVLQEKILYLGKIAQELSEKEGYKYISKKMDEKTDQLLREALESKDIGELRYKAGFISGLEFFVKTVEQMTQRSESRRKRIKN